MVTNWLPCISFGMERSWNQDEIFRGYKEEGYFPEAMVNFLAFLGWNPGTEQEIFSLKN